MFSCSCSSTLLKGLAVASQVEKELKESEVAQGEWDWGWVVDSPHLSFLLFSPLSLCTSTREPLHIQVNRRRDVGVLHVHRI